MVSLKAVVLERDEDNGIYPLKIRITQHRLSSYLKTTTRVSKSQLKKDLSFKDPFLVAQNSNEVLKLYKWIELLGSKADSMNSKELVAYLKAKHEQADERLEIIDFFKEGFEFAETKSQNMGSFLRQHYIVFEILYGRKNLMLNI